MSGGYKAVFALQGRHLTGASMSAIKTCILKDYWGRVIRAYLSHLNIY